MTESPEILNALILLSNYVIIPGITYGSQLALGALGVTLVFGIAYAGEKRTEIQIGDAPSMGPADAPVTIIEFIDFQ